MSSVGPGAKVDALDLTGPHWSFAVDLYGRAGVAPACLRLQDALGVDVNVLLFSVYVVTRRGVALHRRDLEQMDAAIAPWRNDVVLGLRAVRRALKGGPQPTRTPEAEALRSSVKAIELRAEQIQLAALARWFEGEHRPVDNPARLDARRTLTDVVDFYARARGGAEKLSAPERDATLESIMHALNPHRASHHASRRGGLPP